MHCIAVCVYKVCKKEPWIGLASMQNPSMFNACVIVGCKHNSSMNLC